MPLTIQEKDILITLFAEDNSKFIPMAKSYAIKTYFLSAYMLLQNQKCDFIRQRIASHFAKMITLGLEDCDCAQGNYTGINEFLTRSFVANKIDTNFFQNLFIEAKTSKSSISNRINNDFKKPLTQLLNTLFKLRHHKAEAKQIFANTTQELSLWVDNYPYDYFNKEFDEYVDGLARIRVAVFFISLFTLSPLLIILESDYPVIYAGVVSLLIFLSLNVVFSIPHMFDYLKTVNTKVHFDLNTLDEIAAIPEKLELALPIVSMVVSNQRPQGWLDNYETTAESTYTNKKPKKVKFEIAFEEKPILEKVILPLPQPSFFDHTFSNLQSIVLIDPENLGRNNSYFGIWDAVSISRNIKKPEEWAKYDELFSIFKTGKIAGANNMNGIKLIPKLKFFEVKKANEKIRVYGDRKIKNDGKTAVIFEHFLKNGFH